MCCVRAWYASGLWGRHTSLEEKETRYIVYWEKRIPMIALRCTTFSNHGWISHVWNTTYPIIVITLINYSSYFIEVLVELQEYIAANNSSFYVRLQAAFFLLVCKAQVQVPLCAMPINWPSLLEWRDFLNYVYNTCVHMTQEYTCRLYKHTSSHRTCRKAIIEMALQAINE